MQWSTIETQKWEEAPSITPTECVWIKWNDLPGRIVGNPEAGIFASWAPVRRYSPSSMAVRHLLMMR
jgi:hypothetical protein